VFIGLAEGTAGLRRIEVTAYVAAAAADEVLHATWRTTTDRCPVLGSLGVDFERTLRLVIS
jgi:hypothetical protein